MTKRKSYICDFCAKKDGRHARACRRVVTDATTSRWRYLLPSQRWAVVAALRREEARLMRFATLARSKAGKPMPYGGQQANAAIRHAANAGACRILRELLQAIGGHP